MNKKIKITLLVTLSLVVLLIVLPMVAKNKLSSVLVKRVETLTNHQMSYDKLSVSLFKAFPSLSAQIDHAGLNLTTDSLLMVERISADISLWALFKGDLDVKSLNVHQAHLNYLTEDSIDFSLDGLDLDLSGNMSAINTTMQIANISYSTQGFTVSDVPMSLVAQLSYQDGKLMVGDNAFALGEIETQFEGDVTFGDKTMIDLSFESPQTGFESILAILPLKLFRQTDGITTDGQVVLNGFVKGEYNGVESLPSYGMELSVKDAWLQYPECQERIENISLVAKILHPQGTVADSTTIDLDQVVLQAGDNFVNADLNITKPISDVTVKGQFKSYIDLGSLKNTLPIKASALVGKIKSDVSFDGRLAAIEQELYQDFSASGHLNIENYYVRNMALPQGLNVTKASLQFSPERIKFENFRAKLGMSDLRLTGYLTNYFAYFFDDKELKGELNLNSSLVNLNEFKKEAKAPSMQIQKSLVAYAPVEETAFLVPQRVNVKVNTQVSKVLLDDMTLKSCKGVVRVDDSKAMLDGMTFSTLDGQVTVSGQYNSQKEKAVYTDLAIKVKDIDVEKATKQVSFLKKVIPESQTTQGKVSTDMTYYAKMTNAGKVDMQSVKSQGTISSPGLRIANNPSLNNLAKQAKDMRYRDVTTSAVSIDYKMENEVITLAPFDVKMVDKNIHAGGWYSMEGKINFSIKTTVKAKEIGGDVSKYVAMVSDVNKPLPVTVILTGNAKDPNVKYDTREAINILRKDVTKNLNKDKVNSILKSFF